LTVAKFGLYYFFGPGNLVTHTHTTISFIEFVSSIVRCFALPIFVSSRVQIIE
jgi:hypothetical protein